MAFNERLKGAARRLKHQAVPSVTEESSEATTATDDAKYAPLSVYVITRKQDFEYLPDMIASLPEGIELNIVETKHGADCEAATMTHEDTVNGRLVRTWEWTYSKWDFASARNAAMATCTREWCLWMDSDDRFLAIYHNDLINIIAEAGAGVGGFMMGCVGYQPPYKANERGAYYHTPHLRLHRNEARLKWRGYAHEQIDTSIQDAGYSISESAILISHVGYVTDVKALTAKMGRNVMLLCRQIAEDHEYIPAYYLNVLKNNLVTYLDMKESSNV
jgi:hypothetical protein